MKITKRYLEYISFRPLHVSFRKRVDRVGYYMLWYSTYEGGEYWREACDNPTSQSRRKLRQMVSAYNRINRKAKRT